MFYAVRVGRHPGIYTSWEEAKKEVSGYPNAEYKKFKSLEEAQSFLEDVQNLREKGYEIWTDGGAKLHQKAGYGLVVVENGQILYEEYGEVGEPFTNSHAEVIAVYMAVYYILHHLGKKKVTILSDSEYVIKTITDWGPKRKDWKGKAYATEFQEILKALEGLNVEFKHIRGHAGFVFNERADELATLAMKK